MDAKRLRTDVSLRLYAYMVLNAPAIDQDSELARYWIQKGVKAEIAERRRQTGDNLDLNQELVRAYETFEENGELDTESGENSDG